MITEWRDKTIKVIQDWPISAKEYAQFKKKNPDLYKLAWSWSSFIKKMALYW